MTQDAPDAGTTSTSDGGAPDAGAADAGATDSSGTADAGAPADGSADAGTPDAGTDADGCPTCSAGDSSAVARGGQDTNTAAAPDRSACLPSGAIQKCNMPSCRPLTTSENLLLQAAIAGASVLPGIGSIIQILVACQSLANATGNTVAVGPMADVIGIGGASAGYGIYFGPGNDVGVYGSVALDAGLAMGISAEGTFTIIKGASNDNFSGDCWAICASGGEAIVGGLSVIFNTSGQFVGVTVALGIGAGAPFGVYGQFSHTWITTPS